MKKTFIKVKSGLLDGKHVKGMWPPSPLWLYLFLLDRADWQTGVVEGYTDGEAAQALGISVVAIRKYRRRLQEADYISTRQSLHAQTVIIAKWQNPKDRVAHGDPHGDTLISPYPQRKRITIYPIQKKESEVAEREAAAADSLSPKPSHFEESLNLLGRIGVGEPTASKIAALPHASPSFIEAHARLWQDENLLRKLDPRARLGVLILRLRNNEPMPVLAKSLSRAQLASRQLDAEGYKRVRTGVTR